MNKVLESSLPMITHKRLNGAGLIVFRTSVSMTHALIKTIQEHYKVLLSLLSLKRERGGGEAEKNIEQ